MKSRASPEFLLERALQFLKNEGFDVTPYTTLHQVTNQWFDSLDSISLLLHLCPDGTAWKDEWTRHDRTTPLMRYVATISNTPPKTTMPKPKAPPNPDDVFSTISFAFAPPDTARFQLGEISIKGAVSRSFSEDMIKNWLRLHAEGRLWMDARYVGCVEHRKEMNDAILDESVPKELISVFEGERCFPVHIITSADRTTTVVTCPQGD